MKEYIIELSDNENALSIIVKAYNLHELVRCKDCNHRHSLTGTCVNIDGACFQSYVGDDWFCADGVRKDE